MKNVLQTAVVISALFSVATQADYQTELGVAIGESEIEIGNFDIDGNVLGLTAEFNFAPVDTSKGPWAEATFLDKSSLINIDYIEVDFDGVDADSTGLSGRFVTATNLIIEASYQDSDDADILSIGVGAYLNDNLDLVVSYTDQDDEDISILAANLHGLTSMGGGASFSYDLGLGYAEANDENGTSITGGITFYPNSAFGFGASYNLNSADDIDVTTLGVIVDYFVSEAIRLSFSYETVEVDDDNIPLDGPDTLLIGAAVRF